MKKIILITAITLVVIVLAVSLLVSPLTKNYIEKHGVELIGRDVKINKLCINIFTGGVKLQGLAIKAAQGNDYDNFVEMDSLNTKVKIWPMISSKFIISKLHLVGLKVNMWQSGDKFNFDDILAKFPKDTASVADDKSSSWDIGIYDIRLRGGNIHYRDLPVRSEFNMNDISLDIPRVYFSGESTDIGLNLKFSEGGELATRISYDIESSKYKLNIKFKDYSIKSLLPYLQQSLDVGGLKGLLTTDINIEGDMEHILDFSVSGFAGMRDFDMVSGAETKIFAADNIAADIENVNIGSEQYILKSLTVEGFSTMFEMYADGNNNFTTLVKSNGVSANTEQPSDSVSDMSFLINKLIVSGGTVDFYDSSIKEKFSYKISDIAATADNLSSDSKNDITINAVMNGSGKMRLRWRGDLEDINNQNIEVRLSNVNLAAMTPYMKQYFAYPVSSGSLTFTSQNVITGGMLKGTNHLEAYKFNVGKKHKEYKAEYNIPLKTVLYVLKDKHEKIDMSLPVSGNINSPEFSYRKIIFKTLTNLLLKVATAPMSFLGDALGIGKSENMQEFEFTPSQLDFSIEQYAKLKDIAQIIKSREELNISFSPQVDYLSAIRAVAKGQLKMDFYLHNNPLKTAATLETLDYEAIISISDKSLELQQYADSLVSSDKVLSDIGTKAQVIYDSTIDSLLLASLNRIDAKLKDYLIREGVQPDRIKIVSEPVDKTKSFEKTVYKISITVDGEEPVSED